jgi:hypothetical protein
MAATGATLVSYLENRKYYERPLFVTSVAINDGPWKYTRLNNSKTQDSIKRNNLQLEIDEYTHQPINRSSSDTIYGYRQPLDRHGFEHFKNTLYSNKAILAKKKLKIFFFIVFLIILTTFI